jgi:hypothetical protein
MVLISTAYSFSHEVLVFIIVFFVPIVAPNSEKNSRPIKSTYTYKMQKPKESAVDAAESPPVSEAANEFKGRSKLRTLAILIALFVCSRFLCCLPIHLDESLVVAFHCGT